MRLTRGNGSIFDVLRSIVDICFRCKADGDLVGNNQQLHLRQVIGFPGGCFPKLAPILLPIPPAGKSCWLMQISTHPQR